MKTRIDPHQQILKEYDEAFAAFMAVAPAGRCRVEGVRVTLEVLDLKAFEKARERLAIAERELLELDAA